MVAVENLRNVINERLTEVVEEIFAVFTQTLSAYEEDIHRQRRLLDVVLRPEIKLLRTELPLLNVCNEEEEVLADQQLCNQERSPSLDRQDPGPPQVKEEPEELCAGQEGKQLVLKQEMDFLKSHPAHERPDRREDRTLQLDPDRNLKAAEKRPPDGTPPKSTTSEYEQSGDRQFVFHTSRRTKPTLKHKGAKPSDKPFECDICGRDFYLYTHLKVHMTTHPAGKPFSCEAFGKGFGFKRNLKRHIATYSGEKPHACDRCLSTFRRVEHLRVHIRSHTGERPYSCVYCEKVLWTSSALTKHVRQHTGETASGRTFMKRPRGTYFERREFTSCSIPKTQMIV